MHFIGRTQCESAAQTWKTKAPPKCKFFIWLMLQNRIWTAALLQIRGWPNEYFCQLCLRNLETTRHLFCECPMAREVWKQVGNWIQAPSLMPENRSQIEDLDTWSVALVAEAPPSTRPGMRSVVTLMIWELWIERNSRVFKKGSKTAQRVLHSIPDEARNWMLAGNKGLEQLITTPETFFRGGS